MLRRLKNKLKNLAARIITNRGLIVHFDHSQGTWVIENGYKMKPIVRVWLNRSLRSKLGKFN
jgi:hypothetical protein